VEKPADTTATASDAASGDEEPVLNPVDATLPPAPPEPEEE